MGDGLKLGMQRDSDTGAYRFTASARDLRSALYLQFATAVAEEKQFRNCETCGRPFELTPDVARTNRLFCKPYCRIKAYRRRQSSYANCLTVMPNGTFILNVSSNEVHGAGQLP